MKALVCTSFLVLCSVAFPCILKKTKLIPLEQGWRIDRQGKWFSRSIYSTFDIEWPLPSLFLNRHVRMSPALFLRVR